MIRLVPDPTFEHMVRLTVPGHPEPVKVPMIFRHMTVVRADAWIKASLQRPSAEAVAEIVAGWSGVMGPDGDYVDFSPEALARLLGNYSPAAREIIQAWMQGLTESRVKN